MRTFTQLLLIVAILLTNNIFAQEWVPITSSIPVAPMTSLLSSGDDESRVAFHLSGYFKEKVDTPKGQQYVITVPKMASMLEAGSPDLPLFAVPMLIDDVAEMVVEVTEARYHDYEGIEIAPSKGNLSREVDPSTVPYAFGATYACDRFFPDAQAQLDKPYILRDFRGQNILVYPFAYNAVTRTLRVFTDLTLTMKKGSGYGSNPLLNRKSGTMRMAAETEEMYRHRFLNFQDRGAKYTFIPDEGELLVICPPAYLDAMQPFVEWKNASGRPTLLANLADIGNTPDLVKSFILSHYNNPDENLCYVLLVGDYADLTPKSMNGGASDIWFGQLEGNDYYPEVLVGRFSAETVADVEHQVFKTVYYERDITADAQWLDKGVGIGSSEGAGSGHNGGESDYQHIEYIRDTLMHYTYSEVSQHYQGVGVGTNAVMLRENFNAGASICNYCNHGSQTSWYVGTFNNSHVNALTNDYKWPVVWSTACLNGQFNYSQPCFAEAWMRAVNNTTGVPTGAIGGMFSWTSQPWQPPMTGQDEMVDILCEWRNADQYHHTLGGASLNGNMKILDMHPSDQGATHNTWILFGDPSLMLRTANPSELNVVCQPEAIFLGQTELRLTADADFAMATLTADGQVLCSTPIVNGEGILTFDSPSTVGTATLVVTSFNKVTEVRTIDIIPANGAYLTYGGFAVSDDNGQADYGETVDVMVTIKNIGNEAASNVQVTLSSDTPSIEVVGNSAVIPSLAAMSTYNITNGFRVAVSDDIVDGTVANLSLTCTDGGNTWTSQFRMTLHAPAFALAEFRPVSTVNPGEDGQLLVGVRNIGSSAAHNARMQLYSSTTDLTFGQTNYSMGDIPAGGVATLTVPFATSAQLGNNSSMEVFYLMEALQYSIQGVELLSVGSVKETFETGDLSAFAWQTLGGAYWSIDAETAHTGNYSARSGAIGDANVSTLQVEMEVSEDGQISFFKKVCCEANKDKLTFYIDNIAMGEWSGEVDWSYEAFPVTAGTHKFRWLYMKNGSGSYGDDCCWVDDVQFPSASVITFLPELALQAQVNQNEVVLGWEGIADAQSYVVRLDGNVVATQPETSFTQYINTLGTFVYSVSAINAQHECSLPAFRQVEITTLGVDDPSQRIDLFPNPVKDWLRVAMDQPFSYIVLNAAGQQVAQGQGDEHTRLWCGHLPEGVYFLQITTDSEIVVKKFLVCP